MNWNIEIDLKDVFHNERMSFEEIRDEIVKRIKASAWFEKDSELHDVLDELADTSTSEDFDVVWAGVYDLADHDRVWIATQ